MENSSNNVNHWRGLKVTAHSAVCDDVWMATTAIRFPFHNDNINTKPNIRMKRDVACWFLVDFIECFHQCFVYWNCLFVCLWLMGLAAKHAAHHAHIHYTRTGIFDGCSFLIISHSKTNTDNMIKANSTIWFGLDFLFFLTKFDADERFPWFFMCDILYGLSQL